MAGTGEQQMRATLFTRIYRWAAHRLYDELAWAYDAISWLVSFGKWGSWRSQTLAYIQGMRILEVGFGTGELLLELEGRGYQVSGVDNSMAMHRITRKKISKQQCVGKTVLARTQSLPFPGESYDCILSTFPAEYITDLATFLEFNRVLVSGEGNNPGTAGTVIVVGVNFPARGGLIRHIVDVLFGKSGITAEDYFSKLAEESRFKFSIEEPKDDTINLPVMIFEKLS